MGEKRKASRDTFVKMQMVSSVENNNFLILILSLTYISLFLDFIYNEMICTFYEWFDEELYSILIRLHISVARHL